MSRDKGPPKRGGQGGGPGDTSGAEPTIDRTSQNRIGDHLRAMYDGLMQQPVPDRFVELIDRLEAGANGEGHGTR